MANTKDIRHCPLCDAKNGKVVMKSTARKNIFNVAVIRCNKCNFQYSEEDKYIYTDLYPKKYENCNTQMLLKMADENGLNSLIMDLLRSSNLKKGDKILDFGAGIGLASLVFTELGFDVYAVEASNKYLQESKKLGIKSYSSIEAAIEAAQGHFNLVFCKDVLEHVSYPLEMLDVLVSVVKPEGYLYLRVPNANAYWCHWSIDTMGHINHFTPQSLFKITKNAGLKILGFVGVYDIKSGVGRFYHAVFWRLRKFIPLYHQISIMFQRVKP